MGSGELAHLEHFPALRRLPMPDRPKDALVQRRIRMIYRPLHYLSGFASIFPLKVERFEWIDALASGGLAGLRASAAFHGRENALEVSMR